jgi:FkbM family methyltransferase
MKVLKVLNKRLKSLLNKMLRAFAYRFSKQLAKVHSESGFERLLYERLAITADFFFIQIGANDGKSFDPIYRIVTTEGVGGLVIEPVRYYYDQLVRNYSRFSKVHPVNVAIHNTEKRMTLYSVDPDKLGKLPPGAKGIASFSRAHHELSGIPREFIVEHEVACLSLPQLLDQYNVRKVDLLQIDTEGYDAEILLNLDFQLMKPSIIRFEHGLYAGIMSVEVFQQVVERLHENGYEILPEAGDATAYQLRSVMKNLA